MKQWGRDTATNYSSQIPIGGFLLHRQSRRSRSSRIPRSLQPRAISRRFPRIETRPDNSSPILLAMPYPADLRQRSGSIPEFQTHRHSGSRSQAPVGRDQFHTHADRTDSLVFDPSSLFEVENDVFELIGKLIESAKVPGLNRG